ncbi:alpha/beta hydrolase [Thiohalophilus sp.]|uniref:lipase family alpha/beta hydrolase n=1 Tax=Thiohalophilus sp. TaxID=3028392 RepID=UPI002ACE3466|nr:alpha/beta hydrolase [Thiohalophilus sp.]MDZ7803994.1 alpha/beta hydrolase [Thiohalophilus sp.]
MSREVVVLVHGIWMTGLELRPLGRRLRECGYDCRYFRYPGLRRTPQQNAARLRDYLQSIQADRVHLVAHSLGGIVLAHLFEQGTPAHPGRVIMLGTPLQGSVVAQHLAEHRLTRWLLGRSMHAGLLGDAPKWHGVQESAMIAGNRPRGIGLLLAPGKLVRPHDGTVSVSETRSDGLAQHLTLPHTHLSMLFARDVATQACAFLQQGRFSD